MRSRRTNMSRNSIKSGASIFRNRKKKKDGVATPKEGGSTPKASSFMKNRE